MPRVDTITVQCSFAWWWKPYVLLLMVFAMVMQRLPSDAHVQRMVHRALRTKIIKKPADEAQP
ncbi:hypothetical protein [Ralstonia pickettii]|uniref:hypothetical protein n=1 Tax=Ralstonia pickettii TaxID=329 RepID=UPI0015FB439B|nr:hypothetical protein [Ralstonia pickettii]MBB0026809.1 hypothetical protein [Ralstonia pickettii]MBB0034693.1 hypothetical protein [Ralstonia pickettii]MBB0099972.1 hypothetical protein [Ralstonia pickettii]MBB0109931.1 hypothetical protein [Ralstonia pickettii]MBB0130911.1 hypothetical protein [Ralstonia pickettii]